jgi:hypothetical protein
MNNEEKEEQEQGKMTVTSLPAAYQEGPTPGADQVRHLSENINQRLREMWDRELQEQSDRTHQVIRNIKAARKAGGFDE